MLRFFYAGMKEPLYSFPWQFVETQLNAKGLKADSNVWKEKNAPNIADRNHFDTKEIVVRVTFISFQVSAFIIATRDWSQLTQSRYINKMQVLRVSKIIIDYSVS